MIAVIDYGVGNLFSLASSLRHIGQEVLVTGDPEALRKADRLILPGVGAFGDAAKKLRETGLGEALTDEAKRGKPVLGICLGMQLLLSKSFEFGEHEGLGLIPGEVRALSETVDPALKIPHIGWNPLTLVRPSALFRDVRDGDSVYFVHSFQGTRCEAYTLALTEYSAPVTAAVGCGNVAGCQFHPEKSGRVGLGILKAFAETEGELC